MRRDQGRATTVNAAPPGRAPPASSAVRGLAHCLHGAAQEPHAERRRLGGHRDPRPCEVLDAAVLGTGGRWCLGLGSRGMLRGGRRGSGRLRGARLRPRGGVETACRRLSRWRRRRRRRRLGAGFAPPGAYRGGCRTRLPARPRPRWAQAWAGSALGRPLSAYSIVLDGRMAGPRGFVTPGPRSVFLGEHPALGPALACAGIRAASRFFPLTAAETLDFRKYSGYDWNVRLRSPRIGNGYPARRLRGSGSDPRFCRKVGIRAAKRWTRAIPGLRPGSDMGMGLGTRR